MRIVGFTGTFLLLLSRVWFPTSCRPDRLVLRIMGHVRRGVEKVVDAVAAVRAYDRAAVLARDGLAVDISNGVQSAP